MAEAEDVIVDAARHTTVFVRDLWRRNRVDATPAPVTLADLARRLDLLVSAVHGESLPLRVAQPPPPPTLLERLFRRALFPRAAQAVPATDGRHLWLPAALDGSDPGQAGALYRAMALQQARRAWRLRAAYAMDGWQLPRDPLLHDLLLLHEARAAEAEVARALPGLLPALQLLRRAALAARPPLERFVPARRPLEQLLRQMLSVELQATACDGASTHDSLLRARQLASEWSLDAQARRQLGAQPLYRDCWTGDFRILDADAVERARGAADAYPAAPAPRSARMPRRPEERSADPGEDRRSEPGAWMVQQDQPHEVAEDPFGLQRPVDRDDETSADEFGEMVSELPAARMVSTPGTPREVLLSDDPPASRLVLEYAAPEQASDRARYPEWDYAAAAYRDPGSTVRVLAAPDGAQAWVDATLERHRGLLAGVRRQFEMLRAQRLRLRRQLDGEDIDIDACVDSHADLRAGRSRNPAVYATRRPGERSLAVLLLVDSSGSTDGWIGAGRRIIDVEREALLLVCVALEGLREPYAVQAFSGEGPHGVTVRPLKAFDESWSGAAALRIAGLEPERYTRAGAALRHASAELMRQPAAHRLLLLLSDGKPNDADRYDGRYGVEDTRQAVAEARMQGIFPFCLTIDRQAAGYLPAVFGAGGYALLPAPERLPLVLLEWMKRLLSR